MILEHYQKFGAELNLKYADRVYIAIMVLVEMNNVDLKYRELWRGEDIVSPGLKNVEQNVCGKTVHNQTFWLANSERSEKFPNYNSGNSSSPSNLVF